MKLSVITPTFDSLATLPACIKSVLSLQDIYLEYIVIDGGSTDGTIDIIRKYAEKDSRIKWISEPDEGISDAFNKGLEMASGDWIGILNSDDMYAPGALASIAEFIKINPDCDVIHGDMARLDENGNPLFLLKPANVESTIWRQMPLNHPTMFVNRKAYEEVGYFDKTLKYTMDYELVLRLFLAGKKFCYLDKVLAKMSYGGASDQNFISVRREVLNITVRAGYPYYKAIFWFVDHVARGWVKYVLRITGLHSLLRLHPRFHG